MLNGRRLLLPQRSSDLRIFALVFATMLIAIGCLSVNFSWNTEMLTKDRATTNKSKFSDRLQAMFDSFRSRIRSQLRSMESKLLPTMQVKGHNIKHRRGRSKEPVNVEALRKRYHSRAELKKQNNLMFEWNAALQHQILALCVSSAIQDGSTDKSKSVSEIKHDCLRRVTHSVERDMLKDSMTKSP